SGMNTPTLINLPPPPSDPVTPSDLGPGTPNSSLSALSTTAIKDGHQGHPLHHAHGHAHTSSSGSDSSTNTLDAERADRISRLAGLERVTGLHGASSHLAPGFSVPQQQQPQPLGFFDTAANLHAKERSTVGSASATGSMGGRTTWASGSDLHDADKMSEGDRASSSAGLSDEGNASLVGFGEGASSTVSGPISNAARLHLGARVPGGMGGSSANRSELKDHGSPMQEGSGDDVKMLDGMTYDRDVLDTTPRTNNRLPRDTGIGERERAEQAFRDGVFDATGEGR
ncbi:MAG: hypothetical protein Q9214_002032, partial [Letrouitia sp. 1 TL-2023]